jgi:hypothetical protein
MRRLILCLCSFLTIDSAALWAADSTSQQDGSKALVSKSFQIRNHKYGDLLRPEDANSADGTPIVLYPAQHWKCMTWKVHASGESRVQLQNHYTSKTFAAKAGDQAQAPVYQVPLAKDSQDSPTWQVTRLSDGTYKITEVKSGKALTAAKADARSAAKIVIEAGRDGEDQKWDLIEIDPKTLTL